MEPLSQDQWNKMKQKRKVYRNKRKAKIKAQKLARRKNR